MKSKKEKIDDYLNEPLKIGDSIYVQGLGSQDKKSWGSSANVVDIINGIPYIKEHHSNRIVTEEWKKNHNHIGNNPFDESTERINSINFQLESILHQLFKDDKYDIKGTPILTSNFNPFVFVNGKKELYQRPLVWELKDKQLLLESIYNNVDCGKIVVRNRGWDELKKLQEDGHELAWKDVIDGKQRITSIKEFIDGEFPDIHGNYYDDLSFQAQKKLTNHQLFSYSELPENSLDEDVLKLFLRLNFAGVLQSQEHLDFIKSLTTK